MKKPLFLAALVLGCFHSVFTQNPARPTPTPVAQNPVQRARIQADDISQRSNELRNLENLRLKDDTQRKLLRARIIPLYRKPTEKEMAVLAPDPKDSSDYARFLKQKKVGLVKLVADKGCAGNVKVVVASPRCAKYTMPGAGSAYSFRERMHRLVRLGDIYFRKNTIQVPATLAHGIIVNLGNIPLEEVGLESKGVVFVSNFERSKTIIEAAAMANKLIKGIKNDGNVYASILAVRPESTYVLRSIAYRGKVLKSLPGLVYNELDFDNRRDVIVAFRIVRFVKDESITILWKELRNKKSPKIKIPKKRTK
jgi:hypothetical protein